MDTTSNQHASNEPAPNEPASNESELSKSDQDGLLSRMKLIEDQPLASRATAYGQVYDELRQRLEGTDRRND